jgi:hypothetical protein
VISFIRDEIDVITAQREVETTRSPPVFCCRVVITSSDSWCILGIMVEKPLTRVVFCLRRVVVLQISGMIERRLPTRRSESMIIGADSGAFQRNE